MTRRKHDKKRLPIRLPMWLYVHFSDRAYEVDSSMQKVILEILKRDALSNGAKLTPTVDEGATVQ